MPTRPQNPNSLARFNSPELCHGAMHQGKLIKLPDKARRVFPDRLGSLVAGLEDTVEEENGGLEFGKELEIIEPNGVWLEVKEGDDIKDLEFQHQYECDKKMDEETSVHHARKRPEKDELGQVKGMEAFSADEKRSDIEHEVSQKEINLEKLKALASTGLPDGGGLRATVWKLLLGYLPPSRDMWEKELTENRQKYSKLKQELLSSPSEQRKTEDGGLDSDELNAVGDAAGPLKRQEISDEDHPLSVGKASPWNQYFQHTEIAEQIDRDPQRTHPDMKFFSGESPFNRKNREAMRNILLLIAKLNPAICYVQGMNEVLAPILYVFSSDNDEQNAVKAYSVSLFLSRPEEANVEADSFCCFVRLLGESVDHFCQQLDNSPVGILSTLSRLVDLLKANDEELWQHLEVRNKVKPQFYAFRWITLLLTQEFNFHSILRIWDSLLSNPFGIQDMLLRICCAMLLCVKSRLLSGDFAANLRLLQHYPDISIEHLLRVARDLTPNGSLYPLSL
ncbi:hypothetical protein Tsubulata_043404 [Turnera subulata]|uniref:Rab-GAP TBC domain-containing protein n=1 Tax=Turnera subulata TaxID=218843 RepID=A0A9Q0J7R8_9ROSI|nr:hypothetical protein Tsubulata_043404 [Turnera subulata]